MTAALKTVILVHGFCRRGGNMRYLAQKLERKGYLTFAPTLPATFRSVRECSDALARIIEEKITEASVPGGGVVHFVGHSMGGLVIRDYLSRRAVKNLGRIVLIGTPNGGTPHARLLLTLTFPQMIFQPLPDLAEPGINIAPPLNVPAPEVGLVIGTKPDFIRRFFLPGEHDGLVTAKSVRCLAANDELVVPCRHEKLHWRADTAEAVGLFLETGRFVQS